MVKNTVIAASHIKFAKHTSGKKRLKSKTQDEMEIGKALKLYDTSEHPEGESLPDDQRIYRIKVVHT